MKKLPIGIQTFEEIINNNYIYVDKTKYIYNLITQGKTYFLSRPRRFGKSLLCSTLEEVFSGNKELFKGLWIYDSDYDWKKYPVIHLDMSSVDATNVDDFRYELTTKLYSIAEELAVDVGEFRTPSSLLRELIIALSKRDKVVIIIDEYDSPILEHLTSLKFAEYMRDTLRGFYKVLKSSDKYLKFIFITGVTKFSRASVFSVLNNLNDISMSDEFSSLFGYTQDELESNFQDYLLDSGKELGISIEKNINKIKKWYDGYKFSERGMLVYNPWSTMSFFKNQKFLNYWYASGNPKFLFDLIEKEGISFLQQHEKEVSYLDLERVDINCLPINVLLFQTGYLTIKSYDEELKIFTLDYPNEELRESFVEGLIQRFAGVSYQSTLTKAAVYMVRTLRDYKLEAFIDAAYNLFAHIPYPKQNINKEEHYQSMLYLVCALLGIRMEVEMPTNIGRIDLVAKTVTHIFVIEIKLNKSAKEAIDQIENKKYYERFLKDGRKVVLFGINFSTEERNIDDWTSKEI